MFHDKARNIFGNSFRFLVIVSSITVRRTKQIMAKLLLVEFVYFCLNNVECEVLIAVTMKSSSFWDVTPRSLGKELLS
jgi:hypothetical protein